MPQNKKLVKSSKKDCTKVRRRQNGAVNAAADLVLDRFFSMINAIDIDSNSTTPAILDEQVLAAVNALLDDNVGLNLNFKVLVNENLGTNTSSNLSNDSNAKTFSRGTQVCDWGIPESEYKLVILTSGWPGNTENKVYLTAVILKQPPNQLVQRVGVPPTLGVNGYNYSITTKGDFFVQKQIYAFSRELPGVDPSDIWFHVDGNFTITESINTGTALGTYSMATGTPGVTFPRLNGFLHCSHYIGLFAATTRLISPLKCYVIQLFSNGSGGVISGMNSKFNTSLPIFVDRDASKVTENQKLRPLSLQVEQGN